MPPPPKTGLSGETIKMRKSSSRKTTDQFETVLVFNASQSFYKYAAVANNPSRMPGKLLLADVDVEDVLAA
jgi:hypothetical protein